MFYKLVIKAKISILPQFIDIFQGFSEYSQQNSFTISAYFCISNSDALHDPRHIAISDYDYPLPPERIAQFPLKQRDSSRLLVCKEGIITGDVFSGLPDHLPAGSLVIFNETRVIHARLVFYKPSGSRIEIFCLEPFSPVNDVQLAFQQKGSCTWKCLVGNAKRWKGEILSLKATIDGSEVELKAEKGERLQDSFLVSFSWSPAEVTFAGVLEAFGKIPLPPYIDREVIDSDNLTYQTVYARNDGSVAAPTAGLHFTPEVLAALAAKQIECSTITLHVGAGTFKPVSSDTISGHAMHAEQVIIPVEIIEKLLNNPGRHITLVGTTTARTMESLYWQGVKWLKHEAGSPAMLVEQWDPYKDEYQGVTLNESLSCVISTLQRFRVKELKGYTSLLIAPGYEYHIPDAIVTNFHMPKSTLLLLVSAFIGDDWKKAYDYALEHNFRFLSYGDSCLFFKKLRNF